MRHDLHKFITADIVNIAVPQDINPIVPRLDINAIRLNGENGYITGIRYACVPSDSNFILDPDQSEVLLFNPYSPKFVRYSKNGDTMLFDISIENFEKNEFRVRKTTLVGGNYKNKKEESAIFVLRKEYYLINVPFFEYSRETAPFQNGVNEYLVSSDFITKVGSILSGDSIQPNDNLEEQLLIIQAREDSKRLAEDRFKKFMNNNRPLEW